MFLSNFDHGVRSHARSVSSADSQRHFHLSGRCAFCATAGKGRRTDSATCHLAITPAARAVAAAVSFVSAIVTFPVVAHFVQRPGEVDGQT